MISQRKWPVHPVEGAAVSVANEPTEARETRSRIIPESSVAASATAETRRSSGARLWRWGQNAWDRACNWFRKGPAGRPGFEEIVERFALALETTHDQAGVEAVLLEIAQGMVPTTEIELTQNSSPADGKTSNSGNSLEARWVFSQRQSILEIPLRSGAGLRGHLRLGSDERTRWAISTETIRRLFTLCTMAACALERLRWSMDRPGSADSMDHSIELQCVNHACGRAWAGSTILPTPAVHDATFMNAVLPFALGQANRHRESLSLLCVSVDRLAGIKELLGRAAADLLVRNVGESVASLLRSSDLAVRLDDDRIVAILPRVSCENGLLVAEKIRADIADKNSEAALMPGVTVSIGVATYPTSATNMISLLEAADEALSQARALGRDQSVLAKPRPNHESTAHLQTHHHGAAEKPATG